MYSLYTDVVICFKILIFVTIDTTKGRLLSPKMML